MSVTYTVQGTIQGEQYTVIYDKGKLLGDPFAVRMVQIEADTLEGTPVGPVGSYTENKHLSDPNSALVIIKQVLQDAKIIGGETPTAPVQPVDGMA